MHRARESSLKSRKILALLDVHGDLAGINICFSLLEIRLCLLQTLFGMFSQLSELILQFPLTNFQLANGFFACKCYALNLEDFCFHIFTSRLLNQLDHTAETRDFTYLSSSPSNSSRVFKISRESRIFCLMRWISEPARNQYVRLTFGKPWASRISLRLSRLRINCSNSSTCSLTVWSTGVMDASTCANPSDSRRRCRQHSVSSSRAVMEVSSGLYPLARSQEQTHLSGPRLRSTAAAVVGGRPAKIIAYEEHFPCSRRSAGSQWQRP